MHVSFSQLAVKPGSEAPLALFKVLPKTGTITYSFQAEIEQNLLNQPKAGNQLTFNIYESDDAKTWGSALSSDIVVKAGGQKSVTVISTKPYIKVAGAGTGNGGSAKLSLLFEGMQYMGQVDLLLRGKSGFGIDGGEQDGVSTLGVGASNWPKLSV